MTTTPCQAYHTTTGDYTCDRCGVQWDKDDTRSPCKPAQPGKASEYMHQVSMDKIRVILS